MKPDDRGRQQDGKLQAVWRLTRHRAFPVVLFVIGMGLLFGAPLLAQHDEESAPAAGNHETQAIRSEDSHDNPADLAHEQTAEEEEESIHPPTLVGIVAALFEGKAVHDPAHAHNAVAKFLLTFIAPIYSLFIIIILSTLCILATRNMTLIPGRLQNLVEWAVEGLSNFLGGVLGPDGRQFVPFLGTLFLYIYFQNIFGLIPLMFTPTSMVETTASMSILVFLYVQWTAVRMNGPLGYVRHLAGDPRDVTGWVLAPLMLPLHVVGELAKPLSLALRLFGNMMGEETLLAVFMGLGVSILAFTHLPVGIPLQVPFMFLALLTTLIQALVFAVLSTIYFALVLPHHEEEH